MHIVFSSIFLVFFFIVSYYIYKRLIIKLDLSKKVKFYLKIFLFVNYILLISYLLGKFIVDMPYIIYLISSFSIGILFIFLLIAIVYDISRVLLNQIPLSNSRREAIKKIIDYVSIVALGFISIKAIYNARNFEVIDVKIKIKDLYKPYSIVQISDVHISKLQDKDFVKDMVNNINKLKADIVVITGDLIDTSVENAQEALNELRNINSKYGTYYIVGNHEYFYGVDRCINAVEKLDIKVLQNENVYIGENNKGFNLAGVYDVFGYRAKAFEPDITESLKEKKSSPTILLAHQPRFIHEIISGVDLVLSGHTHGGQIHPFNHLVKLQQPYVKGLHQHNKYMQIYINQGTGFWGPAMRLGTKSEITNIYLY